MKYDDASWHSGGEFPRDLGDEAGFTHTGLYFAWAVLTGLGSDDFLEVGGDDLQELKARKISPSEAFKRADGKFTDEDLSDEGNGFTVSYFDFKTGRYLQDYREALCEGLPTMYHVADTWENFDKLRLVLDQRLQEWRAGRA